MKEQDKIVVENINDVFCGYSLFSDIEDKELRTRNRAVILANIAEFNTKDKKISPKAAGLCIAYFSKIPQDERKDVMNKFILFMKERGFIIENNSH